MISFNVNYYKKVNNFKIALIKFVTGIMKLIYLLKKNLAINQFEFVNYTVLMKVININLVLKIGN